MMQSSLLRINVKEGKRMVLPSMHPVKCDMRVLVMFLASDRHGGSYFLYTHASPKLWTFFTFNRDLTANKTPKIAKHNNFNMLMK